MRWISSFQIACFRIISVRLEHWLLHVLIHLNCTHFSASLGTVEALYIEDSTFVENSGGAIFLQQVTFFGGISTEINNCTFISNYAANGGAIFVSDADLSIDLFNNKFINNSALYSGGDSPFFLTF